MHRFACWGDQPSISSGCVHTGKAHRRPVLLIAADQIGTLFPGIALNIPQSHLNLFQPRGDELYLNKQILDHQIVDVEGRRVVRVNDIQVAFNKKNMS